MNISLEVSRDELKNPVAFIKMSDEIIKKCDYSVFETKSSTRLKVSTDSIRTIQRAAAIISKYK
jgi:hypothetical protein